MSQDIGLHAFKRRVLDPLCAECLMDKAHPIHDAALRQAEAEKKKGGAR